jgi:hypothetical protein
MFPKGVAFKIEFEFYEAEKANYGISIRDAGNHAFSVDSTTNTLFVGIAKYTDGFPISYEAHESLELTPHRLTICTKIIHNAIAIWIPQEFFRRGIETVQFVPTFPSYVSPESPWFKKILTDSANI